MKKHAYILAALPFAFAVSVNAKDDHDHDHHDHDDHKGHQHQEAHVHGVANLLVAAEDNELEIRLESPAMNIVGFEYAPSTQKQKKMIADAGKTLENAAAMFAIAGADCTLQESEVTFTALEDDDHHDHGHGHKKHDDHDDDHKDHDHHGHKDHDDHDDHKKSEKETHSDVIADYDFSCDDTAKIMSITVNLLDSFAGIEDLDAQWVIDGNQGAAELTSRNKTLKVK